MPRTDLTVRKLLKNIKRYKLRNLKKIVVNLVTKVPTEELSKYKNNTKKNMRFETTKFPNLK